MVGMWAVVASSIGGGLSRAPLSGVPVIQAERCLKNTTTQSPSLLIERSGTNSWDSFVVCTYGSWTLPGIVLL